MECVRCKSKIAFYRRRDGICDECRNKLPKTRDISESMDIIEKSLPKLIKEIPNCGHKDIMLCRCRDHLGFYWHCNVCN